MKKAAIILILVCACLVLGSCSTGKSREESEKEDTNNTTGEYINHDKKENNDRPGEETPDKKVNEANGEPDSGRMDDETAADTASTETDTPVYYYVNGNGVRMRKDASLESDILILLYKGTKVEYVDVKGEWIKVKYNNEIGYIRNDLLSAEMPDDNTARNHNGNAASENLSGNAADNSADNSAGNASVSNPKIVVKKAERILELWYGEVLYARYPIGLGWEPVGDKKREGDGKTPEGEYYICTRNNYSRFYLSLGLSYPNTEDARDALESGLIDQGTYNRIEDAISRRVQPPWNTALGGEIMIHGHGSHSDWTAGCIAVDNDIMDVLWENCGLGTTVIIEP